MNEQLKPSQRRRSTTNAAEGLPRWRWTTAELLKLAATGIFDDDDDFELIGGEIVPMSPTGRRHELLAELLERALRRFETDAVHLVVEKQLNLAEDTFTKPDLLIRPANVVTYDARGSDLLLVVEVAQSSLQKDLTTKAQVYAKHGVREYWVVDTQTLVTTVHRGVDTSAGEYTFVTEVLGEATLTVEAASAFSVRLADLDL